MPKVKDDFVEQALEDKTILAAIIISSVSSFLIIFIGISIFINRENKTDKESYSTGSTSSNSTYLQYSTSDLGRQSSTDYQYVLGDDGRIYQTIDFKEPSQYNIATLPCISNNPKIENIRCQKNQNYYQNV